MKKFLIDCTLFLIVGSSLYCIFIFCGHHLLDKDYRNNSYHRLGWWGYVHSRMAEIRDTSNVDVLVLGSSHAYRGFDTRAFERIGLKAMNMGSGAQSPIITEMLVKRHIDRLDPEVVLFEVTPIIFSSDPLESSLDIMANDINDKHSLQMIVKVNHIKAYNSMIISYLRDVFKMNEGFKENPTRGKDKYVSGGFVERKMETFKKLKVPQKDHEIRKDQLVAFENILEILKESDIEYYLIQSPITNAKYKSHSINSTFDSLMNSYGNYTNFNEEMVLDDSLHFYDGHHLNQTGVDSFNNVLLRKLNL